MLSTQCFPWLVIAATAIIGSLIISWIESRLPVQAVQTSKSTSESVAISLPDEVPDI